MDAAAFDRLSRTLWLAGSRRAALGALLASAGGAFGRGVPPAAAQGCQPNGTRCRHGTACCSGRCKQRHRDKHGTCRQADHQGVCTVEENASGPDNDSLICGDHDESNDCLCYVTTRGRSFCGAEEGIESGICGCTSNKQCEKSLGKGAKCVGVNSGCNFSCPSGTTTGCMAPCPILDPIT
jgi:hypothetical protein